MPKANGYDRRPRKHPPMGIQAALRALVSRMYVEDYPELEAEIAQAKRVLQYRQVNKPWQQGAVADKG